jgi:hypothetical protein
MKFKRKVLLLNPLFGRLTDIFTYRITDYRLSVPVLVRDKTPNVYWNTDKIYPALTIRQIQPAGKRFRTAFSQKPLDKSEHMFYHTCAARPFFGVPGRFFKSTLTIVVSAGRLPRPLLFRRYSFFFVPQE